MSTDTVLQRGGNDQAVTASGGAGRRNNGRGGRGRVERRCVNVLVTGRTCGARLPKRARKYCRRCRGIQERRRRQISNRNYFQANKVEIIAQRRNHRHVPRVRGRHGSAGPPRTDGRRSRPPRTTSPPICRRATRAAPPRPRFTRCPQPVDPVRSPACSSGTQRQTPYRRLIVELTVPRGIMAVICQFGRTVGSRYSSRGPVAGRWCGSIGYGSCSRFFPVTVAVSDQHPPGRSERCGQLLNSGDSRVSLLSAHRVPEKC